MGFYEAVADSTEKSIKNKTTPPKRNGFHEVEQIELAEGWRQIVAGEWQGIGLLDVVESQDVWGKRIIIADASANRKKLREYWPGVMIVLPAEFMEIINGWPDTEALVRTMRVFDAHIVGGAA